jgi:phosphoserine aminotransferase
VTRLILQLLAISLMACIHKASINMKKHNFSAGPAILPATVFEQASQAVANYNDIGLSILEISHRSPEFVAVLSEASALVRELLQVPEGYEVLFLQGGASSQFFMTAMNLLDDQSSAAYIDTGSWSAKAIKEARLFGHVDVLASSKDENYTYIPKSYTVPADSTYLHITSNNTIFGTQYKDFPATAVPLVADMSSDIFSKPIDVSRFGLIYAGAQKNLGPAGVTLVIVKSSMLGKVERSIPTMLDYRTHIKKGSAFNTPPVYPIYVSLLTLRWLKEQGGLEAISRHNTEKANMLYEEIDRNPMFKGTVTQKEDRSVMNVTFIMEEAYEAHQETFLQMCAEANCVGIKGHRSVGGFRASIYNAMPKESLVHLLEVMQSFADRCA